MKPALGERIFEALPGVAFGKIDAQAAGLCSGPAEFRHKLVESRLRPVHEDHGQAFARRHAREFAPNSRCGAGHDNGWLHGLHGLCSDRTGSSSTALAAV